ncbi:MAG: T9SS C-terminal target domain-containing protein [Bacteroidia bacterium]|nr:T9SS C-terminal target domain-containing protein [Bacteroidia bacterium]
MKNSGMTSMKNQFGLFLLFIAAPLCNMNVVQAQKAAVPISTYGVWDRGEGIDDYSDPKADFVLGIEVSDKWSNVQSNGPDKFDFSTFQNTLDRAAKYHKIVKVSINVGPDSPTWLYDNGVPLVKVVSSKPEKHAKFPNYPYYLSDAYIKYYFELIKQFSLFLRNQPKEKFDCIAFVQVKTGATGDEAPYKGEPIDKKYVIANKKAEWEDFRLESFAQFKKYFNDVNNRQIVLVFNAVDPDKQPIAYNWVMNTIDPQIGFGIKGGAYNRGHHLSGEQSFKEQWTPYLINPKGMKLFSASEMDESWNKAIFNINTELGFYWSALSGINTGLSSYNASKQAIIYAYEHKEISDIFRMFNKYAQQVYPATTTTAFSVFHEGLNAADTVKFPEKKFGKASEKNLDRYSSICKAYESRGAKMDDLKAVTIGQVNQREQQTGYNDVGWDIAEGNYERFLTQIKPDETSIGLFRVRGTIDKNSSKYDRFARSFENSTGKNTMYFKFDDEMFANSKPESLRFTITWLDKNAGSTWSLNYNNGDKSMKSALNVKGIGDNQWKTQIVTINDAIIDRSGKFGSDFMLVNTDKVDDIFNGIEVDITRKK